MVRFGSSTIAGALCLGLAACGEVITPAGLSAGASASGGEGGAGGGPSGSGAGPSGSASAGSGSSSSSSSSSLSASAGTGGGGTTTPETITFSGVARRSPTGEPLEKVQVCVFDEPSIPCVLSGHDGGNGTFTIQVPASAEIALTLARPDSTSVLFPFKTGVEDISGWGIGIPAADVTTQFYSTAGQPFPNSTFGFIEVFATQGNSQEGEAGVVVSLDFGEGVGPLYGAPGNATSDATLTATSSAGTARFAKVPEGVTVRVSPVDGPPCALSFGGWPNDDAASARVPIASGFETHLSFSCQ